MSTLLIRNATLVNEGKTFESDVFVKDGFIHTIGKNISQIADTVVDAAGLYLLPGCIDDQVHFREPGLTTKTSIFQASRAAAAGGVTSFMDMPNTIPQTTTQELLEAKYELGRTRAVVNYSFYIGATNHNLEEVLKTDGKNVCGIKVFMGSSTGDMLVDNHATLEDLFRNAHLLVATHCEKEEIVKRNLEKYKAIYGDDIPVELHPVIRDEEACYASSSEAVALARKHGTKLHVLHISTVKELELFDNTIPLTQKRITAEACLHHLWFDAADYATRGSFIKWNPAIKSGQRDGILAGVLSNKIDVIATDHAPHTFEEKQQPYTKCPSGAPLVQHSLVLMLELVKQGKIPLTLVPEKMAHSVATLFQIDRRGYLREGYYADMVLVDLNRPWRVQRENVLYPCGWSPLEGERFSSSVVHTFVNGNHVVNNGMIDENHRGMRLAFERE